MDKFSWTIVGFEVASHVRNCMANHRTASTCWMLVLVKVSCDEPAYP